MRLFFLLFASILLMCSAVEARDIKQGDLFHITGCENGELMVPVVNLWNGPERTQVVGRLSGNGRADKGLKCQGAVVKALETTHASGRTFIKIKSVVGSQIGWITDLFVGRRFDRAKCKKEFSEDPKYLANCLGN